MIQSREREKRESSVGEWWSFLYLSDLYCSFALVVVVDVLVGEGESRQVRYAAEGVGLNEHNLLSSNVYTPNECSEIYHGPTQ